MTEDEEGLVSKLFLANFVHQVINPLNGIIGTLDNIYDGTYSEAVARQKINASRAQLEECVTLMRNLAYLSDYFGDDRADSVLRKPRPNAISILPQVIIEAIQFFQIAASQRNIAIELTDPNTQYRINVRPELLKQIFINLFDNWVKYGIDGTRVAISPRVNSNAELVTTVSGKSIGFNNNESERLFELGFRSSVAKSKIAQGSGIGLFICRSIIERELSGTISASHSHKTEVTTFRISIPASVWRK